MTKVMMAGKGRKVTRKLDSVTGTPAVPPKMTVEHRGKLKKRWERGAWKLGCKSPCTIFSTSIAEIKFLLEIVCSASSQKMVGTKRDTEGTNQLGFPLLWSSREKRTTVRHPLCSAKPFPASLSTTLPRQTVEENIRTQPEGSWRATELVPLCCMLDLIYTTNMTQKRVLPIVASIKPLLQASLSFVNRFHYCIKWMY